MLGTIRERLIQDPAFAALIERTAGPALPAAAAPLLLEELAADAEGGSDGRGPGASGNPLLDLLRAVQSGIGIAANALGEGFVTLGNFLRGLGDNIGRSL